MGWDAYATKDGSLLKKSTDDTGRYQIADVETRRAFEDACTRVEARGLWYDGLLSRGGLDVSLCGDAMRLACGIEMYGDDLTPEDVEAAFGRADWSLASEVEPWAVASAQEFMRTCVEKRLGIKFDW